jgi:ATP-dependent DNA helicase RecQ
MVGFVENIIDCRHSQLSSYFGEKIEEKQNWCNNSCDNCIRQLDNNNKLEEKDMTPIVEKLLYIIREQKTDINKYKLCEIYQNNLNNPLLSNLTLIRLINKMIQHNILQEHIIKQSSGFWSEKIVINNNITTIKMIIESAKYSLADFIISNHNSEQNNNTKEDKNTDLVKNEIDIGKSFFANELMNDSLQEKYNLTHLPLYNILINYRNQEAKRLKCAPYRIFNNLSLEEIVKKNPTTELEVKNIVGIGEAKFREFGKDIIKMVKNQIS